MCPPGAGTGAGAQGGTDREPEPAAAGAGWRAGGGAQARFGMPDFTTYPLKRRCFALSVRHTALAFPPDGSPCATHAVLVPDLHMI